MRALDFDPLTCDLFKVIGYQGFNWGCDCNRPEGAHHSDSCSVTPIYAELTLEYGHVQWIVPCVVYLPRSAA